MRYVDHVLALLPFEPEEYRRLRGPPCTYVGHPLTEQLASLRPNAEEQKRRDGGAAGAAGAAGQPAQRDPASSSGVRRDARRSSAGEGVAFEPMLPTMPHLEAAVREGVESWEVPPQIVTGENEKRAAFRIARAALAKSGTVTLELALVGRSHGRRPIASAARRPSSCGVRSGCRR